MGDNNLNIDEVITTLLSVRRGKNGTTSFVKLPESTVANLCRTSQNIFGQQPMLIEVDPPIKICGDIHGQYGDLLRMFDMSGYPPIHNYLFLGDYVDRGKQSIEVICLLLAYKVKYPENFFLLRGNHEEEAVNIKYGFFNECKRRYSIKLFKTFTDVFNVMPLAAIVGDKIFCAHGGISPDLEDMNQIKNLVRPTRIPRKGLMCDLLWADPDHRVEEWGPNTDRDVSVFFGPKAVTDFLEKFDLDLIARAHMVVEDGYEFFAKKKCVTIFSAPNYTGDFDNSCCVMKVTKNLSCSFEILKPIDNSGFKCQHHMKKCNNKK